MDALGRRLAKVAKLTRNSRYSFIDVISVLKGNMKHSRTIEFELSNRPHFINPQKMWSIAFIK